jgi:hypothetical protein
LQGERSKPADVVFDPRAGPPEEARLRDESKPVAFDEQGRPLTRRVASSSP